MSSKERRPGGADDGRDGRPGSGREDRSDGGMDGRRCPQCGTPRTPGGAPACGCTERTADAARDARSADAAAAGDFDPLRIRPYVTLPEPGAPEEAAPGPGPGPLPAPVLPPEAVAPPRSADVGLFAPGAPAGGALTSPQGGRSRPAPPYDDEAEPRRRRGGLYAGVGAAVAVVAVAVLAAVLLTPDKPQREQALPDVPTRAVTDPSGSATRSAPTASPSLSASPSPSSSPSASTSASREASPSSSPSSSPSRTTSRKPRSTTPPSRSTARATGSADPKADGALRRGDRGPEVRELQQRLQQLYLYMGEAHGTYNTQVADAVARYQFARGTEDDGEGVYGERTRAVLEAETREP